MYANEDLYRIKEIKRFVGYRVSVFYQSTESSSGCTGRDKAFKTFKEMKEFCEKVWNNDREVREAWKVWDYYPESVTIKEFTRDGRIFEVDFLTDGKRYDFAEQYE